jgi:hypothetical protein
MNPKTDRRNSRGIPALRKDDGLLKGAIVMTLDGEIPVEHLTVGDRVITRDSGMARLTGIETRVVSCSTVRIKAGTLGHTRPERDVTLSGETRINIRDWRAEALFNAPQALVPAKRLADGEFITALPLRNRRQYHLQFERDHILYVDGLEIASPVRVPA